MLLVSGLPVPKLYTSYTALVLTFQAATSAAAFRVYVTVVSPGATSHHRYSPPDSGRP